jgi:AraC-like DNA-binding protein
MNYVLYIALAALFLSGILIVILSRIIYSPIDQTQKDNKKYLESLKENFYRQILLGLNDESALYERAEEYSVNIDYKFFQVIVFRIDGYYAIDQSYRNLHETSVCQIAENLLRGSFDAVVVSIHEGETAKNMTFHRLTLGFGQIIDSAPDLTKDRALYPGGLESNLIDAMRLGNKDAFTGRAGELLAYLKPLGHQTAKLYLMQISLALIRSIDSTADKGSETAILDKITKNFDELETLSQADSLFAGLFDEYQRVMKEINLGSSYNNMISIISRSKTFILENYKNPNLNIDLIADQFGYTATYFAKIFKDVSGEFINDFIRERRISQAKNLLTDTRLSVAEVAVMSGYSNTNYFFYAFKKHTGLTPSAYRSSHTKQVS